MEHRLLSKQILIVGSAGYIGSRLSTYLHNYYTVKKNDICWFNSPIETDKLDYSLYTKEELKQFDVIIVLAGHSSVKTCDGLIQSPWKNNVTNFTSLLSKIDNQVVIYASSASVYGSSNNYKIYTEQSIDFMPLNNYDITKYVIDQQALIEIQKGKKVIGLRFGTVNGWSPQLRVDVMINSMIHNILMKKNLLIMNKHINRAILGIEDLCRAIYSCIQKPVPGIYNLSSFNTTVEEVSSFISNKLNVSIIDQGNSNATYNFALDTSLFQKTYKFAFQETPDTIINNLLNKYEKSTPQYRDKYIIYT
jgi:nucleoside-diphosphate-sugar epimerase